MSHYPLPIIVIDMGTATTVSVIDRQGEYRGGLIMPGLYVSLDALVEQTSLLSHISLADGPKEIIGTNTNDCIAGGVLYGNAAMLDGIVDRLSEKLGSEPTVIVTGIYARLVAGLCRKSVIIEEDLLLKGLRMIYLKNRRTGS